jgi:nitroreductase
MSRGGAPEDDMPEFDLFEIMSTCRAMRRLRPDPVADEDVRRLIEAANFAPSGRNLQRARWIVVRDAEQRRRIAAINRRASLEHATAGRDASEGPRRRMWEAVLWQTDHMHEAPVIVVACCIMDDPDQDPGRYASSIWPGVQNLLLAARALELGATPTTYALAFRDDLERTLELPPHVRAMAVIPVGHPMGRFGPVTRRPVDESLMLDRWRDLPVVSP